LAGERAPLAAPSSPSLAAPPPLLPVLGVGIVECDERQEGGKTAD
jgi:hypothetical protein